MSKSTMSAFTTFTRVAGVNNTLASFYPQSGNQERISSGNVSLNCYHTKLVTVDGPAEVHMGPATQHGQMKKLYLAFKGTDDADMTVVIPSLLGTFDEIVFKEEGDFALLQWSGGAWIVLETGNSGGNPSGAPIVQ